MPLGQISQFPAISVVSATHWAQFLRSLESTEGKTLCAIARKTPRLLEYLSDHHCLKSVVSERSLSWLSPEERSGLLIIDDSINRGSTIAYTAHKAEALGYTNIEVRVLGQLDSSVRDWNQRDCPWMLEVMTVLDKYQYNVFQSSITSAIQGMNKPYDIDMPILYLDTDQGKLNDFNSVIKAIASATESVWEPIVEPNYSGRFGLTLMAGQQAVEWTNWISRKICVGMEIKTIKLRVYGNVNEGHITISPFAIPRVDKSDLAQLIANPDALDSIGVNESALWHVFSNEYRDVNWDSKYSSESAYHALYYTLSFSYLNYVSSRVRLGKIADIADMRPNTADLALLFGWRIAEKIIDHVCFNTQYELSSETSLFAFPNSILNQSTLAHENNQQLLEKSTEIYAETKFMINHVARDVPKAESCDTQRLFKSPKYAQKVYEDSLRVGKNIYDTILSHNEHYNCSISYSSAQIDRCIDLGVLVPVVTLCDDVFQRTLRPGESKLFECLISSAVAFEAFNSRMKTLKNELKSFDVAKLFSYLLLSEVTTRRSRFENIASVGLDRHGALARLSDVLVVNDKDGTKYSDKPAGMALHRAICKRHVIEGETFEFIPDYLAEEHGNFYVNGEFLDAIKNINSKNLSSLLAGSELTIDLDTMLNTKQVATKLGQFFNFALLKLVGKDSGRGRVEKNYRSSKAKSIKLDRQKLWLLFTTCLNHETTINACLADAYLWCIGKTHDEVKLIGASGNIRSIVDVCNGLESLLMEMTSIHRETLTQSLMRGIELQENYCDEILLKLRIFDNLDHLHSQVEEIGREYDRNLDEPSFTVRELLYRGDVNQESALRISSKKEFMANDCQQLLNEIIIPVMKEGCAIAKLAKRFSDAEEIISEFAIEDKSECLTSFKSLLEYGIQHRSITSFRKLLDEVNECLQSPLSVDTHFGRKNIVRQLTGLLRSISREIKILIDYRYPIRQTDKINFLPLGPWRVANCAYQPYRTTIWPQLFFVKFDVNESMSKALYSEAFIEHLVKDSSQYLNSLRAVLLNNSIESEAITLIMEPVDPEILLHRIRQLVTIINQFASGFVPRSPRESRNLSTESDNDELSGKLIIYSSSATLHVPDYNWDQVLKMKQVDATITGDGREHHFSIEKQAETMLKRHAVKSLRGNKKDLVFLHGSILSVLSASLAGKLQYFEILLDDSEIEDFAARCMILKAVL